MKSLLALVLIMAMAPMAFARDLTSDERLADFDQLVGLIKSQYGVLQYKKETLGIDIDELVATYRPRIQTVTADGAFYDLMHAFVSEFKDGHFGLSNPTGRRAFLGFRCRRVEDRAVIEWIDRKALGEDVFPFAAGDELVAIDGKPVERLLAELLPSSGHGNEANGLQAATTFLTMRHGSLGAVPTGVARVDVRRRGGELQSVMLPWLVKGQALPGLSFHGGAPGEGPLELPRAAPGEIGLDPVAASTPGRTAQGALPEGALPLPTKFFPAYMFDTPKGPMGYIRIPDFMPENNDADGALTELASTLEKMRFTRGLVLDTAGNPGGFITYCYKMATLFVSKPLEMQTVSMRATRKLLASYMSWRERAGSPHEAALVDASIAQIRAALEQDRPMTEFGFPYGVSAMAPTPPGYDKPIVVLIDEGNFSCGDIFPALMKDNGRAVLFGHTTGGGGGAVTGFGALSYSGIAVRMTLNLWKRSSGEFIENHGVSPDIAYEHTQKDVADGYKAYREAYTKALLDLVK